jgi:microcin C transport system substrate-binding protein
MMMPRQSGSPTCAAERAPRQNVTMRKLATFGVAQWRLLLGGAMLLAVVASPAAAQGLRHGLSIFGTLKYPADFQHFDWVNPNAPKGGRLATIGTVARTTFDSFNAFILKGDPAQGLDYLYDSLMTPSLDEPDAVYGLVASGAEVAGDSHSVTFHLRPEAAFADGSPLRARDVVFTFFTLKREGHPLYQVQLEDVTDAVAVDPLTVRYTLAGAASRDLPLLIASLPILPEAYYQTHKFAETTLDPPFGSGPYRLADFRPGAFVSYRRREDYWAKDLPVNRGRFNFDELRFEYYRDRTAELESLKAGAFDLREEFTARDWVTAYDVPALKAGRLVRLTLPDERPAGAQGFFLNTRRSKLADPRVREALDDAFDFEWMNKNIFYGLYTRTESFFENSDLKASGMPSAGELALLEPFRNALPPEVFAEPYRPPVSDGTGNDRRLLRKAGELLNAAGWQLKDAKLVDARGEALELEFLIVDQTSERVIAPYLKNLLALGIQSTIRRVDPAQYERRVKAFDFDIVTSRFALRPTPGVELKAFLGSAAATTDGSYNLAGIANPAVDALLERIARANSREELATCTRALDRVLRAGHYWVPQWYRPYHYIAYWNKYDRPTVKPRYARGIIQSWWYDAEKAAKLQNN